MTQPGEEANRFRVDLAWNFASLFVLAASGITLNVVIGRAYDSATLGVFNQVFAAFIFFSMAASGGLNFSVLRTIAEKAHDRAACAPVMFGAIVPAVALSATVALLFWWSAGPIAALLDSEPVASGIRAATPGLFFFALNKVLLAATNGLRRMRAFAVYQALRYVLILGGLLLAVALAVPGAWLAGVFTFGETVLFVVLVVEVATQVPWWRGRGWPLWSREHLRFGARSVLSGIILELNSRVDILMLGYFLNDAKVGVYSYAAMFAEGFFQLLVVLRNNYNPILARHIGEGRLQELQAIVRRGRIRTYLLMPALGVAAMLVYPWILAVLTNKPEFQDSHEPFVILVIGILLSAGYQPFASTLAMANLPGWHTLYMCVVVASNIVANAVLIPLWGMNGAAAGTALALVISALVLRLLARRLVRLHI